MYEAPISIIETAYKQIQEKQENDVLEVIASYDITVDRNELVKALRYDRGQYDKGYHDGIKEFSERFLMDVQEYAPGACYYYADLVALAKDLLKGMESESE